MAKDKSTTGRTLGSVEIPGATRRGRDIFAINNALRQVKEQYLAAVQAQPLADGEAIVLTLTVVS